jgi:hypothetical protein
MGSPELFCLGWSGTVVFLISSFHIAGMIGVVEMGSLDLLAWTALEMWPSRF